MKHIVFFFAMLTALSCCFAQSRHNRQKIQPSAAESGTVRKESGRAAGTSLKFKYTVEKIRDVSDETDVKFTLAASSANHKVVVKCDRNDGGMSWKLFDEAGNVLDENWWSGLDTKVSMSRCVEGEYYIVLTDALGKQARYKIKKKIN